jgi:hypothetical protein
MKLYHFPLSGHAHRAALFLSLAGVDHEIVPVDLAAGAHKQPEFLALNAFGEVPVLDDNGIIIADRWPFWSMSRARSARRTGCRLILSRRPRCSAGCRWRRARSPMAPAPRGW